VANKLRIPPIVGYLFAGILIGPFTPGFQADADIAEQLSEIGIVMLMFGVGLHFSLKDLMEVRRIALPGAIAQIICATALGAFLAQCLGWSMEAGLIFGLALSVASTVVLLRALEDQSILQTTNGHIAIGWLIVEDLVMVLALVLIPAFASLSYIDVTGGAAPAATATPVMQLFTAMGKVVVFVAVMLIAGRRALPWMLMTVARTSSRELFTLAVFAAAVGVAFASAKLFGVSLALGAFFAGMMIRESDLTHEVAKRILPFQDAFAVLFFVTVGMLFDPSILVEKPLNVLAVVMIIMFGKSVAAFLIVMFSGYPLKTALLVSSGLAQIGEFSFILVALGITYGLLPEEGRDYILAGAMISIALNPAAFWVSHRIYEFVDRHPRLSAVFNMGIDNLATLCRQEREDISDHVILAGHGRVGKQIARHLRASKVEVIVIDSNRESVESLRHHGFHVLAGDAGQKAVLKEAQIDKAVAIAIAVPDSFEARRIVESARAANPLVRILVRAHNDEEMNYLLRHHIDLAITGPREISRRIMDYLYSIRPKPEK
jgi:CPA2 family monovalent cation:H+ antiporter-2